MLSKIDGYEKNNRKKNKFDPGVQKGESSTYRHRTGREGKKEQRAPNLMPVALYTRNT